MDILKIEHISKNYSGHCALHDVSLSVPEKSVFGLLGPNGAGKTSLIRIITQINSPDKGKLYFRNEKLEPHHAAITGYLPEERGLYKKMKVKEQLVYLGRLKGLPLRETQQRVDEWLGKMELSSWSNSMLEDLSKGMQQKVQFIAAVIHKPSLLILDEPFTGFDPINAELVKNEILQLRNEGTTIILSTHRMESIEELCDHIAMINKSKKILEGPVGQIKNQFKENIYLIEGMGSIEQNSDYKILSEADKGSYVKYKVKAASIGENEILKSIMKTMTVKSFREEIPSIQDIFISKVKESYHE